MSELIFFIDRSLGGEYVSCALREIGETVIVHDDRFENNAPDEVWLNEAGRNNWVVLTKDKQIRHNFLEREAVRNSKCRMFVLVAKDLTGQQMADIFIKALGKIKNILMIHEGPFIAKVWREGQVNIWEKFE